MHTEYLELHPCFITHVYACINYIFSAGDVYSSVHNYMCMHVRREGMCTALYIYSASIYDCRRPAGLFTVQGAASRGPCSHCMSSSAVASTATPNCSVQPAEGRAEAGPLCPWQPVIPSACKEGPHTATCTHSCQGTWTFSGSSFRDMHVTRHACVNGHGVHGKWCIHGLAKIAIVYIRMPKFCHTN